MYSFTVSNKEHVQRIQWHLKHDEYLSSRIALECAPVTKTESIVFELTARGNPQAVRCFEYWVMGYFAANGALRVSQSGG